MLSDFISGFQVSSKFNHSQSGSSLAFCNNTRGYIGRIAFIAVHFNGKVMPAGLLRPFRRIPAIRFHA